MTPNEFELRQQFIDIDVVESEDVIAVINGLRMTNKDFKCFNFDEALSSNLMNYGIQLFQFENKEGVVTSMNTNHFLQSANYFTYVAAHHRYSVMNNIPSDKEIQDNPLLCNYSSSMALSEYQEWITNYVVCPHRSEFIPIFHDGMWIGVLIQPKLKRALVIAPCQSEAIDLISSSLLPIRFKIGTDQVSADEEFRCSKNDSGVVVLAALYLQIRCCPAIFRLDPKTIVLLRNFFGYHFIQSRLPWP